MITQNSDYEQCNINKLQYVFKYVSFFCMHTFKISSDVLEWLHSFQASLKGQLSQI